MGQSPGPVSPRVLQLVQCLRPYGNPKHSREGGGAVPGGHCGRRSVKTRLLAAASVAQFVSP